MSSDSHDKMIDAFQEYFKWQTRFEYLNSDEAGVKARNCLNDIRKQALNRREEIMAKRKARKAARNGARGRPPKITK
jgi:hypothetical protein